MQHIAKGKKSGGVLGYLVALMIMAAISTFVALFYSIRSAYEHLPDQLTLTRVNED
jgi:uncharacterized membrane protein